MKSALHNTQDFDSVRPPISALEGAGIMAMLYFVFALPRAVSIAFVCATLGAGTGCFLIYSVLIKRKSDAAAVLGGAAGFVLIYETYLLAKMASHFYPKVQNVFSLPWVFMFAGLVGGIISVDVALYLLRERMGDAQILGGRRALKIAGAGAAVSISVVCFFSRTSIFVLLAKMHDGSPVWLLPFSVMGSTTAGLTGAYLALFVAGNVQGALANLEAARSERVLVGSKVTN